MRRPSGTETAHLVIGRMSSTWFMSCSEPMSANGRGPCPPMMIIGTLARCALATPVTASVRPGPGGHHRHAGPPGDARPAVGGMRGGLFVAHVDDADALVEAAVVDRHHVPAAKGEDERHLLGAQRARHQPSAVNGPHQSLSRLARCVRGTIQSALPQPQG